jgi:hypothetical protein
MSDFFLSIISGAIGGLIVLLFQKIWEFFEKKKQNSLRQAEQLKKLIISPQKHLHHLERRIIDHLLPGTSVEKMKEVLGVPDFTTHEKVITELSDVAILTNTYSFKFANANLLLTSVDNKSLDSITVSTNYIPEHPIEFYHAGTPTNILAQMTFSKDLEDYVEKHTVNRTMRDAYFCIELYLGRSGQYQYFTLFGHDLEAVIKYQENPSLEYLFGKTIDAYCISSRSAFAPFISRFL